MPFEFTQEARSLDRRFTCLLYQAPGAAGRKREASGFKISWLFLLQLPDLGTNTQRQCPEVKLQVSRSSHAEGEGKAREETRSLSGMMGKVRNGAGHHQLLPAHREAVCCLLILSGLQMFRFKLFCNEGPSHAGFFSPHQAVWIACSLCATSHRCCFNWYAALTGAPPIPCQDTNTGFGIKALRSSAEVFRGITSASAVWFSIHAKAAMLLNSHALIVSDIRNTGCKLSANMPEGKKKKKAKKKAKCSHCKLPHAKILPLFALRCPQRQSSIGFYSMLAVIASVLVSVKQASRRQRSLQTGHIRQVFWLLVFVFFFFILKKGTTAVSEQH